MNSKVTDINPKVLRQCREQIYGNSLDEVKKKIPRIEAIEAGKDYPTYKQLEALEDLYSVPNWVFSEKTLPSEYSFKTKVVFRNFFRKTEDPKDIINSAYVRKLVVEVEDLRELILDLAKDIKAPIPKIKIPYLKKREKAAAVADRLRKWLGVGDQRLTFDEWRERLENKNIFIYVTAKKQGRPSRERDSMKAFRGFSIYHDCLPIIVINDTDAKKAQVFTLFHELGHILRKETAIDSQEESDREVEQWCDELAGCFLMPEKEIRKYYEEGDSDIVSVKEIAKKFKVSPYACAVRLSKLGLIDRDLTQKWMSDILASPSPVQKKKRNEKLASRPLLPNKKQKQTPTPKAGLHILRTYGHIYIRTVSQAYYEKEIHLHKLCQFLDLKDPSAALSLIKRL